MKIDWKLCAAKLQVASMSLVLAFLIVGAEALAIPVAQVKKCRALETGVAKALGLGSGLAIIPEGIRFGTEILHYSGDPVVQFLAISDRGPNVSGPKVPSGSTLVPSKVFAKPDYAPRLGVISCHGGKYEVSSEFELRTASGKRLGGLPPIKLTDLPKLTPLAGELLEESLTPDLQRIAPQGDGVDPEAVAIAKDGSIWIAEEYGPSLLHVDAKGKLMHRWYPGEGLPLWLRTMQPNRGFEGIAILPDSGDIILAMQSARVELTGTALGFIDILRLSPEGKYLGHYRWPLQMKSPADFGEVKIGDIWAISSDSLLAIRSFRSSVTIERIDGLKPFNRTGDDEVPADSQEGDFKLVSSHTLVNLSGLGWKKEKTEGLTVLPDGKTIVVMNDDDFSVKGRLDIKTEETILREDGLLQMQGPVKIEIKEKKKASGPELWFIELETAIAG